MSSMSLDQQWAAFLENGSSAIIQPQLVKSNAKSVELENKKKQNQTGQRKQEDKGAEIQNDVDPTTANVPPLIISTKSNNAKLNGQSGDMDVWSMFWALNVIPYITIGEGVIKKQIKIQCKGREELEELNQRLQGIKSHTITKEQLSLIHIWRCRRRG